MKTGLLRDELVDQQAVFETDVEFSQDDVARPDVLLICYQPEGERLTRAADLTYGKPLEIERIRREIDARRTR